MLRNYRYFYTNFNVLKNIGKMELLKHVFILKTENFYELLLQLCLLTIEDLDLLDRTSQMFCYVNTVIYRR